jgi:predicted transcriptional regulator
MPRIIDQALAHGLPDAHLPRENGTPRAPEAWRQALPQRRRDLGLSQNDLAVLAFMQQSTISAYETGKRSVPRRHARWIDRILDERAARRTERLDERSVDGMSVYQPRCSINEVLQDDVRR